MTRFCIALCLLAAAALSGCANFKAVTSFANQTTQMTSAMRTELTQIGQMCREHVEIRIVVTNEPNDSLFDTCKLQGDALVPFQEATVETIDLYAQTLLAMVDDSSFDLRPSIEATGQKVAALKTRDGSSLVSADKVTAITKVLALLADVIVQRQRVEGIRKLVAAGPDMVAYAMVIRQFFFDRSGQSSYDRWLETVQVLADGSATQIRAGSPLAVQEPIRTAELRRTLARAKPAIGQRRGQPIGAVPEQLVAALDAWIALVPEFQKDALRPDPESLLKRIDALRKQVLDTRLAVQTGF